MVVLAVAVAAAAYFVGYLPQLDLLFTDARADLAAHHDQIFNLMANGAPFLAAAAALLFLRRMIHRAIA